jgi:hypothetical protein
MLSCFIPRASYTNPLMFVPVPKHLIRKRSFGDMCIFLGHKTATAKDAGKWDARLVWRKIIQIV